MALADRELVMVAVDMEWQSSGHTGRCSLNTGPILAGGEGTLQTAPYAGPASIQYRPGVR